MNRHAHTELIEFYSPLGIWHVFLYSNKTNIHHFGSMKSIRVNTTKLVCTLFHTFLVDLLAISGKIQTTVNVSKNQLFFSHYF